MSDFVFDCAVCSSNDVRQASPPELKYVINKPTGKGASVQCCRQCARMIDENAKAEREKAERKRRKNATAKSEKSSVV